jgi:hypothetical protein
MNQSCNKVVFMGELETVDEDTTVQNVLDIIGYVHKKFQFFLDEIEFL